MRKKPDWLKKLSLEKTLQMLEDFSAMLFLRNADVPEMQDAFLLIRERRFAELLDINVNYVSWEGREISQLKDYRQLLGLYQKLEELEIGVDKEEAAFTKWRAAEEACAQTNDFFRKLDSGYNLLPELSRVLYAAREKIKWILGDCPKVADLALSFGPGATTSVARKMASAQNKLAETPTCSENLLRSSVFSELCRAMPHWLEAHQVRESRIPDLYSGYYDHEYIVAHVDIATQLSELVFVPKNARTYRSIVLQSTLDTILQKGIGKWIEERLRKHGVDIKVQKRNRLLAFLGSLRSDEERGCPEIATFDLSSASDTISYWLVKFLLPTDWFNLLLSCRASDVNYNGTVYHLAQFSSMGNGYTFPLETLIFYALTVATISREGQLRSIAKCYSVYGDDIIIPSACKDAVRHTLESCGFVINTDKSFWEGPFRESCGADYFRGIDIRPTYFTNLVSAENLYTFYNACFLKGDEEFQDLVLKYIPKELRRYGPPMYGDGHLHSSEVDYYRTRESRRCGFSGFYFKSFKRKGCHVPNRFPGDYVTPLYMIYTKGASVCEWKFAQPNTIVVKDMCTRFLSDAPPKENDYDWRRPLWALPDSDGYEEVSIYTLSR